MDAHLLAQEIDRALPDTIFIRSGGSLLIMVGLPGTGKSQIAGHLGKMMKGVVISTDAVRRHLWPDPAYSQAEMSLVYDVCHWMVEQRLMRGQRVIFDATNLLAARRADLLRIAQAQESSVAVCRLEAKESAIRERLAIRKEQQGLEDDLSDAGWPVYRLLVESQEPIVGPYLTVDTTSTPPNDLAEQIGAYWLTCEAQS